MSSLRALLGQPVIASDTAERLGSVDGIVIDPRARKVLALQLGANKSSRFVGWDDINAIGADAVMVSLAQSAREAHGPLEERVAAGVAAVLTKLLLDAGGDALGTVDDLEFDETTGTVHHLDAGGQQVAGERIIGIGAYAVVVSSASLT